MVSLQRISRQSDGECTWVTYEENAAGFHNIEIRTCLVHSTEDRTDTERSNGGIKGIHLDILSKALGYILRGKPSITLLKRAKGISAP